MLCIALLVIAQNSPHTHEMQSLSARAIPEAENGWTLKGNGPCVDAMTKLENIWLANSHIKALPRKDLRVNGGRYQDTREGLGRPGQDQLL